MTRSARTHVGPGLPSPIPMHTYIDLFSGVGGVRLAAAAENLRYVLSVERDPYCAAVQEHNFGEQPSVIDIHDLADTNVPCADLVIATPPCQPYSMQGRRLGLGDPRATVWWDVLRVLRASRARVLLLENVPGLVYHDHALTIGSMVEYLRLAGYRTRWQIIEASRAGGAQHRPRLYLVASRFDLPAFDFGRLPRLPPRPVADILTPGPHVWLAPASYTLLDPPVRQPSGLIFAGYLNKPLRKPGRDPRLSGTHRTWARVHDSAGVYPTLLAGVRSGRFLLIRVENRVRQLVPLECQRLQGFPDSFHFPFPAVQDHQIGNSIYVPLVRHLLREVMDQLLTRRGTA